MNFTELASTCFNIWRHAQKTATESITVTTLGPPGTGKTTTGKETVALMTAHVQAKNPNAPPGIFCPLDLSGMLPEDLMGLPDTKDIDPMTNKRVTKYIPHDWMAPLCEEGAYGVLVLDDLAAAQKQVQVACRQVSLERRIHQMKLSPGIFVLVTGNRREDKSAASTLPSHFLNSVMVVPFTPDFKGWEEWYMNQGFETDIPAFLNYKPAHFSRLPKDADTKGSFATPRSWALLGKTLPGLAEDQVTEAASGLVGEGVAVEYAAFRLLRRELVAPEQVLENPEKALPSLDPLKTAGGALAPDRMVALVTGLGEVAARKATRGKAATEVLTKYLYALAYVTSDGGREYVSVSISTFVACKGSMKDLVVAAQRGQSNPKIKELIKFLDNTINGRS